MYEIIRDIDHQAKNINWLEFELNNQCQYASAHDWCPRNKLGTDPKIELGIDVIEKVISFFKKYNFSGRVYFSIHNEPLLDNRLLTLVKYVKRELPKCSIQMFTNGIKLNKEIGIELLNSGIDDIEISVYSGDDFKFMNLCHELHFKTGKHVGLVDRRTKSYLGIDNRINIYSGADGIKEPCFMPTLYYFVNCKGDVQMCFQDWLPTKTWGNLYADSVEKTLMNEDRLLTNYHLVNNNRKEIKVCSSCDMPANKCTMEFIGRMKL